MAGAPDTFLRGTEATLRVNVKRSRSFEMETSFRIMRTSNGVETTSALTGRASVGRGAGLVQVVPERGWGGKMQKNQLLLCGKDSGPNGEFSKSHMIYPATRNADQLTHPFTK